MKSSDIILKLGAAEFHWHFTQGIEALNCQLYVPGVVSLINGVEASIRVTVNQISGSDIMKLVDLGAVMSNSLLRNAGELGLPVESLAFPGELDFSQKLQNNNLPVEMVRIRNNLCHGNIIEYIQDTGSGMIFTPECLEEISGVIKVITLNWIIVLGKFRNERLGL